MPALRAALAALVVAAASCADHTDDRIRAEVSHLTLTTGDAAQRSAAKVAEFGRRALPQIEASLPTADAPGRKNLILALRRLGDVEAVPLLLHVAVYDADPEVRREAELTLRTWAKETSPRADKAREAARKMEEWRGAEENG